VQTVTAWDAPPSFGPLPDSASDAGVSPGDGNNGDVSTGSTSSGGCAVGQSAASWPIFALMSLWLRGRRRDRKSRGA
jgi:hypothetical protein